MDESTLEQIAEFICGYPVYRSGDNLTKFFKGAGLPQFVHDGSTRRLWVLETLKACTREQLALVFKRLASPFEYGSNQEQIRTVLKQLNNIFYFEGFKIILDGNEPKFKKIAVNLSDDGEVTKEMKLFPSPNFLSIGLKPEIDKILKNRWDEAQHCGQAGAYLSAIIIMGSILEGLLLGIFQQNPAEANKCASAPKDPKTNKIKKFSDWKLAEMIDVAHQIGWINTDVQKFSHALRDFRNLIHPYEQMTTGIYPDADTYQISWSVVQAAVNDLVSKLQTADNTKKINVKGPQHVKKL